MEIEPERMDPQDRPFSVPFKGPKKWQLILFGAVALVIGIALLFFMFWIALFFLALGALSLLINLIRSWFRGDKPGENTRASVKFYIGRGPPEA